MNPVRRLLPWAALLAGAALIAAGTWVVALRFQSPAQREAAASPPPAGPVTVQVTRGDLTEQTTVLATAARSEAVSVAVPAPAEGRGVVTRSGTIAGGSVSSGGAVLWVNSRPVIALAGQFALYRDLYLGARGDDVRMVQQALADLGYDVGVDGELGAGTADAVRDLYRSLDAQAPQDADAGQAAPAPQAASPAPSGDSTAAPGSSGAQAQPALVLPAAEVMIVPTLPAVVTSVPAVGATVDGQAAVVFGAQEVTLSASMPAGVQARMTPGLTGTADLQGQSVDVAVAQVRPASAEGQSQGAGETAAPAAEAGVVLRASSGQIPAEWVGRSDVLITLNLSQPVLGALLVPQRAVSVDAGGTASVLVAQEGGAFAQVVVTELGCTAGTCAVSSEDGQLAEGMSVRVDG